MGRAQHSNGLDRIDCDRDREQASHCDWGWIGQRLPLLACLSSPRRPSLEWLRRPCPMWQPWRSLSLVWNGSLPGDILGA